MITEDDVLKIAALANLSVGPDEIKALTENLNSILGYVESLKKIDVSSIAPMSHVHGSYNVFREDVVEESSDPEQMLKNAPDRSGRFLKVPIIIAQ